MLTRIGLLNYFVACLCKTSEAHLEDSRAMPLMSVCVLLSLPSKLCNNHANSLPRGMSSYRG